MLLEVKFLSSNKPSSLQFLTDATAGLQNVILCHIPDGKYEKYAAKQRQQLIYIVNNHTPFCLMSEF